MVTTVTTTHLVIMLTTAHYCTSAFKTQTSGRLPLLTIS